MAKKESFTPKSQKEKTDIIIALIVILFFALLFWWLFPQDRDMAFSQKEPEEVFKHELLATEPENNKSEDVSLFGNFSIGGSLIPDSNLNKDNASKMELSDRSFNLEDFNWSSWFGFLNSERDADEDGILDEEDKCPNEFGILANMGCPSDLDHDGIWDTVDKCPEESGLVANFGCPEIIVEKYKPTEDEGKVLDEALKNVQFRLASSEILESSYSALDRVAQILKNHPELNLEIEGHTDNEDSEETNKILSAQRALSCKNYIIALGIRADRISSKGFGESRPIADNSSKEGRAQNRRVEFNLTKSR